MTVPPEISPPAWRSRLQRLGARVRAGVPFASGVAAALLALLAYNALTPREPPLTLTDVNNSIAAAMASATAPPAYSAVVYQIIQPSLVAVQTELATGGPEAGGLGTGVVIDDSGSILTSLHVVEDAANIKLTFADGTEAAAVVAAIDPASDIAVLRPSNLPNIVVPAVLGNPNAMRVGDEAYVVGHPLGLYGSMSAGVVSGFNRTFQPLDSDLALEGLIQVDAAVNPGNSGGPLLNRWGQVVGIVVGIVNPTEQDVFIGISFAVPINVAGGAAGLPQY